MDKGAKNIFSVPRRICFAPLGFDSPVAIFETVLFLDKPNEMGSPVSFYDLIPKLLAPEHAMLDVFVHAGDLQIMLINTGFFK